MRKRRAGWWRDADKYHAVIPSLVKNSTSRQVYKVESALVYSTEMCGGISEVDMFLDGMRKDKLRETGFEPMPNAVEMALVRFAAKKNMSGRSEMESDDELNLEVQKSSKPWTEAENSELALADVHKQDLQQIARKLRRETADVVFQYYTKHIPLEIRMHESDLNLLFHSSDDYTTEYLRSTTDPMDEPTIDIDEMEEEGFPVDRREMNGSELKRFLSFPNGVVWWKNGSTDVIASVSDACKNKKIHPDSKNASPDSSHDRIMQVAFNNHRKRLMPNPPKAPA